MSERLVSVEQWKRAVTARGPSPNYGPRDRFGPWHRQAVRFVGRRLERFGAALDSWSWGWHQ